MEIKIPVIYDREAIMHHRIEMYIDNEFDKNKGLLGFHIITQEYQCGIGWNEDDENYSGLLLDKNDAMRLHAALGAIIPFIREKK